MWSLWHPTLKLRIRADGEEFPPPYAHDCVGGWVVCVGEGSADRELTDDPVWRESLFVLFRALLGTASGLCFDLLEKPWSFKKCSKSRTLFPLLLHSLILKINRNEKCIATYSLSSNSGQPSGSGSPKYFSRFDRDYNKQFLSFLDSKHF